jgi:hypothetical protein
MDILQRIRSAFEPNCDLVEIVLKLKEEGVSQREIYDNLETVRQELNAQGREREEEYVWDVQDRVWGFCAAQYRFFETSLSNSDFAPNPNQHS